MFRFGDPGGRAYSSVGTNYTNIVSWWSGITFNVSSFANVAVIASGGRTTGSCLRFSSTNSASNYNAYLYKILDNQQTWGIAFAYKQNGSNPVTLAAFQDSGTTQCDLRVNSDGSMSVTRNGTSLGTTSPFISSGVWNHIEFKVKIDPSVGTVSLWINGVSKLSLTSQNTRATSNSFASTIVLGNITNTGNAVISNDCDDIIVYDGQTTDPLGNSAITGPIGDNGLVWLLPNGAGTTTQFTRGGTDSGANWSQVNDATPNGDTNYVESNTLNGIDTYACSDLPSNATGIKSISVVQYVEKTDVGTRQIAPVIRTAGTNYVHPTSISLVNSYGYYFNNFGSNPSTTVAWTVSDINGLEVGQEVTG